MIRKVLKAAVHPTSPPLFIGLMSGTSLDGVNGVLASIDRHGHCQMQEQHYLAFDGSLRDALLALNTAGANEIERSHLLGNRLAHYYAQCVTALTRASRTDRPAVSAIGCHGQTIRHRPELGFTVQIGNAALLAELTGIRVVSDFRSRDIAAGGQGAPLVPAFHQAAFATTTAHRVIVNIGGISNLSSLPPVESATGFDCGPGNVLMDGWIQRHHAQNYDRNGDWAARGNVIEQLLQTLLAHPFFDQAPPKSTGRDTFHMAWLEKHLSADYAPADVQATLLELSARSISDAVCRYCAGADEIYLCGGGAHNSALVARLRQLAGHRKIALTDELGVGADWVEAAAFAWLAYKTIAGEPANLPDATGAAGPRILGAIYPA